ncbi:MAG: hypothetical protein ACOX8S_10375 [Christensenellales bacterium]|jgi:hypothetical protein
MRKTRKCFSLISLLAVVFIVAVSAAGCGNMRSLTDYISERQIPGGYLFSGGDYDGDVIIRSLELKSGSGSDDFTVEISFAQANSAQLSEAPKYYIYALENPSRLMVAGDFASADDDALELLSIEGAHLFAGEKGGYFYIYLQLTDSFVFSAEEGAGRLKIDVGLLKDSAKESFFPAVSPGDEASERQLSLLGFSPAVKNSEIVYVSGEAFSSIAQAEEQAQKLLEENPSLNLSARAVALRDMNEGLNFLEGLDARAVEMGAEYMLSSGETARGEYWLHGSKYLCGFGSSMMFESSGLLIEYGYDGFGRELELGVFEGIIKAQADPDTRHLAVLSGAGLQVFDIASMRQMDLGEALLERSVSFFDWGDDGRLYFTEAGSGERAIYSLDVNEKLAKARETEEMPSGRLMSGGGRAYFACEDGAIWYNLIASAEGLGERLVTGDDFALSANGKLISILYGPTGGESFEGLVLIDIETGAAEQIYEGSGVEGYLFSINNQLLHYLVKDGESEDFPFALYSYRPSDDRTFFHGRLPTDDVFALPEGNMAMVRDVGASGKEMPVTYKLRLNYYN